MVDKAKKIRAAAVFYRLEDMPLLAAGAHAVLASGETIPTGKNPWRTASFFATRYALMLVARCLHENFLVGHDAASGRPVLLNTQGEAFHPWQVSLADTVYSDQGVAVAAIASESLGVDVEIASRGADHLLHRVATSAELLSYQSCSDGVFARNRPLALFAAKEAAGKALGVGLGVGFQNLSLDLTCPTPVPVAVSGALKQAIPSLAVYWESRQEALIAFSGRASLLSSRVEWCEVPPAFARV